MIKKQIMLFLLPFLSFSKVFSNLEKIDVEEKKSEKSDFEKFYYENNYNETLKIDNENKKYDFFSMQKLPDFLYNYEIRFYLEKTSIIIVKHYDNNICDIFTKKGNNFILKKINFSEILKRDWKNLFFILKKAFYKYNVIEK